MMIMMMIIIMMIVIIIIIIIKIIIIITIHLNHFIISESWSRQKKRWQFIQSRTATAQHGALKELLVRKCLNQCAVEGTKSKAASTDTKKIKLSKIKNWDHSIDKHTKKKSKGTKIYFLCQIFLSSLCIKKKKSSSGIMIAPR